METRQVAMIFVGGLVLLLVAFWAGTSVVRQDPASGGHDQRQATQSRPAAAQPGDEERYVVFVGAFGTAAAAKQLESELHERKYQAAYVQMASDRDALYRVNVGPYDRRDADRVAGQLVTEGRKGVEVVPWTRN